MWHLQFADHLFRIDESKSMCLGLCSLPCPTDGIWLFLSIALGWFRSFSFFFRINHHLHHERPPSQRNNLWLYSSCSRLLFISVWILNLKRERVDERRCCCPSCHQRTAWVRVTVLDHRPQVRCARRKKKRQIRTWPQSSLRFRVLFSLPVLIVSV